MSEGSNDRMTDKENNIEVIVGAEKSIASLELEQKKKKLKKGVNGERLKITEYEQFLKEYKVNSSPATCVVFNQRFSINYHRKADIDDHMKTQKQQKNMKPYDANQILITNTIKSFI